MAQGPAIPTYILRGHVSPVHNLLFVHDNAFLASGDSDGWLVVWSIASKRPVAVWKAHEGGVTGIKTWEPGRLITHGRDHKLRVWKLDLHEPVGLSTRLPVEGAKDYQPQPWLLHSMDMSALNFCAFAICAAPALSEEHPDGLLVASPNGLDTGGIDIFHLPKERRVSQLHSEKNDNTGMVMSLAIFQHADQKVCLVSGYEDGRVMVHWHQGSFKTGNNSWQKVMSYKAHTQPILSLSLSPQQDYFITSSADAAICKIPLSKTATSDSLVNGPSKTINTKHAGQQGVSIRSDGRIFVTAGWDAKVRVYSAKTMKELAVLKWHKEGCSSTTFARIQTEDTSHEMSQTTETTLGIPSTTALDRIKQERSLKAQQTHWLAVGGKDGKISLWDIY